MLVVKCEQGKEEWHQARLGIPTASCFSKLITQSGAPSRQARAYRMKLLAEWLCGAHLPDEDYISPAMSRGYMLQPQAIKFYEMEREVDVEGVGFVYIDERRLVGCSPDGLVDGGGVEIKCPYSTAHMEFLLSGELPDQYRAQVQEIGRAHV